jgi:hypothetical protein
MRRRPNRVFSVFFLRRLGRPGMTLPRISAEYVGEALDPTG